MLLYVFNRKWFLAEIAQDLIGAEDARDDGGGLFVDGIIVEAALALLVRHQRVTLHQVVNAGATEQGSTLGVATFHRRYNYFFANTTEEVLVKIFNRGMYEP